MTFDIKRNEVGQRKRHYHCRERSQSRNAQRAQEEHPVHIPCEGLDVVLQSAAHVKRHVTRLLPETHYTHRQDGNAHESSNEAQRWREQQIATQRWAAAQMGAQPLKGVRGSAVHKTCD